MANLFKNYGIKTTGVLSLSPGEAFESSKKGAIIVDIRERDFSAFKAFGLPGVINMPKAELEKNFNSLPKNRHLIVADSSGTYSKEVVVFLKEKGFQKVAVLAGGFIEWERDNLPVNTDIKERLSGSCACQLKPRERKQ